MGKNSHLAFDLGAESGRALLGTLHGEKLAVEEVFRFANHPLEQGGHLHWDLFKLVAHCREGLKLAADSMKPGSIQSIGVDTWGVDFALLDEAGKLLHLPYCYRDSRTEGAMESFFRKIPKEEVYQKTGIQFLPFNTLFQLESMVRDTSPYLSQATDLLFMPDLIHYLLTGKRASEFTFATTSQLYNPLEKTWDTDLIVALGVKENLFQKLLQPGDLVGELTENVQRQTGVGNVPVYAVATHDTGSAVAAVPAKGRDWAFLSTGTWSLFGFESDVPILTDQTREMNFTNEGGVCGSFRILKNIMGLWLLQQCRKSWASKRNWDYSELTTAAKSAAPFGCLIEPDDPSFLNPPDMPAAIGEYLRKTGQPGCEDEGQMARCILESLALKYRFALSQAMEICPRSINRIHVIGGGSQNELLCQMTADATGLPVYAGPVEATAIGNLLVQAMAMGTIADLPQLRSVVRNSFPVIRYDPQKGNEWEDAWKRFQDLMG